MSETEIKKRIIVSSLALIMLSIVFLFIPIVIKKTYSEPEATILSFIFSFFCFPFAVIGLFAGLMVLTAELIHRIRHRSRISKKNTLNNKV